MVIKTSCGVTMSNCIISFFFPSKIVYTFLMHLKSLSHQPSLTSHESAVIIAQEKGKYLCDKGTTEEERISVFTSTSYHMHGIIQEKLLAYLSIFFRFHIKL